jgi:hypothetical protein
MGIESRFSQLKNYLKIVAKSGLPVECFEDEDGKSCRYLGSSQNTWSFRIAPQDVASASDRPVLPEGVFTDNTDIFNNPVFRYHT